ncbi:hypothetical protein LIER_41484 [Lithospermum erythrorhizon]|uniref:Uncharacterized protein n=1 Tax=Lithospermum erythrorhizon TaxID=34254 RepID=A0AAV3RFT4_LITER
MSLFSYFDALVDSFGHKVIRRPCTVMPSSKEEKKQDVQKPIPEASTTVIDNGSNKGKEACLLSLSTTSLPNGETTGSQKQRRHRFALELDGVLCFETIVPY